MHARSLHLLEKHIENNIKNFRFWLFIANACLLHYPPNQQLIQRALIADKFARYLCPLDPITAKKMLLDGLLHQNRTLFIYSLKKYILGIASADFSNLTTALAKLHDFILEVKKSDYDPQRIMRGTGKIFAVPYLYKNPKPLPQPRIEEIIPFNEVKDIPHYPDAKHWNNLVSWAANEDIHEIYFIKEQVKKNVEKGYKKRFRVLLFLATILALPFLGIVTTDNAQQAKNYRRVFLSLTIFSLLLCIYFIKTLPKRNEAIQLEEYHRKKIALKTRQNKNKTLSSDILNNLFDLRITEYISSDPKEALSNLSLVTTNQLVEDDSEEEHQEENQDEAGSSTKIKRWKTFSSQEDDSPDEKKSMPENVSTDSCEEDLSSHDIIRVIENSHHTTKLVFKRTARIEIADALKSKLFERAFGTAKIRSGENAKGTCFRLFSSPVTVSGNTVSHIELKVKKYNDRLFGTRSDTKGEPTTYVFSKLAPGLH